MSPSIKLSAAVPLALARFALVCFAFAACQAPPPEPTPDNNNNNPGSNGNNPGNANGQKAATDDKAKAQQQTPEPPKSNKRKVVGRPAASVTPSEDDPLKGVFSLDDATKGLPAGKQISATIETSLGKIECKLFDDKAPITVANFVGLARGVRPWKTPEGKWEKKPAYDGTVFHRIIKGFMIQGGDAKKNGSGEAGYVIPDEVWEDGSHDRPGLLCMANRGKNTNSAQFFITDEAAFHLDNGYTIFGECGPVELIHKIAGIEVQGDRPKDPPDIKKVTITRK